MIAGIFRKVVGREDGHYVAALDQCIGQPVRCVGDAAGLCAIVRWQLGGQYRDFHSASAKDVNANRADSPATGHYVN